MDTVIGYASITKGTIPSEILPDEYRDIFEKGDARLMAVFFDDTSSAEGTMEAIAQIRKIAGQQCFVSGLSAVVTDTKQLVEDQEAIYVAIAVALCCVVLMLTMDSILLPFIFLLCIGVSILWNMGTNYFLGEISYITKAVAAVLQLGVTLDYSIFLWHSYQGRAADPFGQGRSDGKCHLQDHFLHRRQQPDDGRGLRRHLLHELHARP